MLPIAGQTAGPNGLNFFVDTHGCPHVCPLMGASIYIYVLDFLVTFVFKELES